MLMSRALICSTLLAASFPKISAVLCCTISRRPDAIIKWGQLCHLRAMMWDGSQGNGSWCQSGCVVDLLQDGEKVLRGTRHKWNCDPRRNSRRTTNKSELLILFLCFSVYNILPSSKSHFRIWLYEPSRKLFRISAATEQKLNSAIATQFIRRSKYHIVTSKLQLMTTLSNF